MARTTNAAWSSNDWLVVRARARAPQGASTEIFRLDYGVILQPVVTHKALVYMRHDVRNGLLGDSSQLIGVIAFGRTQLDVDGSDGSWWRGFTRLFTLGLHHIAEGTDHLLFLSVLLLAAPLVALRNRWAAIRRPRDCLWTITKVISGFTLGHSLTLALGALGWVPLPGRAVEVLIAISILVSALHAARPLFANGELWIASAFGLVHGLAFATTLSGLSFDGWTLAVSLLGFNLGIETMQLVVMAVLLPVLIALSRTRWYSAFRWAAALFATACAAGWIGERAFHAVNTLAPIVDWLASPLWWALAGICVASAFSLRAFGRRWLNDGGRTTATVCRPA